MGLCGSTSKHQLANGSKGAQPQPSQTAAPLPEESLVKPAETLPETGELPVAESAFNQTCPEPSLDDCDPEDVIFEASFLAEEHAAVPDDHVGASITSSPSASPFDSVQHKSVSSSSLFWSELDAAEFVVRSAGYAQHNRKEASAPALYDCVAVDVLRGKDGAETELTSLLHHRKMDGFDWWREDDCGGWDDAWGVPRVLVVNSLLPIHSPVGWSKKPPACSMVAFFRLSKTAREALKSGQHIPQLGLWQRLVRSGVSTRDGTSFKAIGQLPAASLSQLPSFLQGYNGKPALITYTCKLIRHKSLQDVLEIDIDVSQWSFMVRQSLYSYQDVLAEHAFHLGFLVEGRTETELPEQMLATFCIRGADLKAAVDLGSLK
eukprot:TRINITY_DN72463_c0_g1_i1.p1 TRINITY_DN72463_c0_g1~~TRINITY_DN72463_c0_g1_i1.p1  ORF type:complete len:377 (+),score=53.97 TRINITY_DN72463_c0_g1_i1:96-1226(+)